MSKVTIQWENVIPAPIPTKFGTAKGKIDATYTTKLELEAQQTSKLFRAKIEADLKRLNENLQKRHK